MIRAGLRRLVAIVVVVVAGAAAISAALGALAGKSVPHALAIGYYLVGAGVLLGSLALGSRGPTRVDRSADTDDAPAAGTILPLGILFGGSRAVRRRKLRKATSEERREARLASLGLFVFGVLLVLLGAVLDPTRRAF